MRATAKPSSVGKVGEAACSICDYGSSETAVDDTNLNIALSVSSQV